MSRTVRTFLHLALAAALAVVLVGVAGATAHSAPGPTPTTQASAVKASPWLAMGSGNTFCRVILYYTTNRAGTGRTLVQIGRAGTYTGGGGVTIYGTSGYAQTTLPYVPQGSTTTYYHTLGTPITMPTTPRVVCNMGNTVLTGYADLRG